MPEELMRYKEGTSTPSGGGLTRYSQGNTYAPRGRTIASGPGIKPDVIGQYYAGQAGGGQITSYSQGSGTSSSFGSLIEQLQAEQEKANLANEARYEQMMAIYDETIDRYKPGGAFQTEALRQLEIGKGRAIGKETQDLISSGLFGTTTRAALGGKWEEQVGAPSRLKLEDIMMQRLTQAQLGKAGAIERREDVGPGYDLIAQLASQYGQGAGGGYTPGYTGGGGGYFGGGSAGGRYNLGGYGGPSTQYRAPTTGTGMGPGGSGNLGISGMGYTPKSKPSDKAGGWIKPGSTEIARWGGKGDYNKWASEMRRLGWSPQGGATSQPATPAYKPRTGSTWDATNYPWL